MDAISQRLQPATSHNDNEQPFQSPPPPHSATQSSRLLSPGDLAPPGEEVPPYTTSPGPASSGPLLAGLHAPPLQSSPRRDSFVAGRHSISQDEDLSANTSSTVPAQPVAGVPSERPPPHLHAQHLGDDQEQTTQLPPPPYESEGQPTSRRDAGGEDEGRLRRAMREMMRV